MQYPVNCFSWQDKPHEEVVFTLRHCPGRMSCLTKPTARTEEVKATQRPSIFSARGDWSARLDSTAGGDHQSRRRTLQAQSMSCLEAWSVGWRQQVDFLSSGKTRRRSVTTHSTSYSRVKAILRNSFRTEEDSIHPLYRAAQVTILSLRTGHCQLLFYLHRLTVSHSDECPCGTGPYPQPHPAVLPHLRRFQTPDMAQSSGYHRKLWELVETLRQTADFALLIGLKIWHGLDSRRRRGRSLIQTEQEVCSWNLVLAHLCLKQTSDLEIEVITNHQEISYVRKCKDKICVDR